MTAWIGLLLGSRDSAGALVAEDGKVLSRVSVPNASDPAEGLQGLRAMVARLLAKGERLGAGPVGGVGVGFPGVVDPVGRIAGTRVTWRQWQGYDLAGQLSTAIGMPVAVRNDVVCVLFGEQAVGAAVGETDVIVAYSSAGLGGALLVNGALITGRTGAAGHLGHMPVAAAAGLPCTCGGVGHLDSVASASGMARLYRDRLGLSSAEVPYLKIVTDAAAKGDPVALAALRHGGRALGSALGGVANLLEPDVVVLAGESAGSDVFCAEVATAIGEEIIPGGSPPEVRRSKLGGDAILVGAALAARAAFPADN